ncbi:hypothetical protein D3C73_928090 [compost metagenome]
MHHGFHQGEFVFGRHAAGGLVHDQQLGAQGQRHGHVQQLALAFGQFNGRFVGFGQETHQVQRGVHFLLVDGAFQRAEPAQFLVAARGGNLHALAHGVLGEQLRQLERTAQPQAHDLARCHRRDVAPVEIHLALRGRQVAGADVDEGGLARAVLADDGQAFAFMQFKVDVVGRDHAAEGQVEVGGLN